MNLPIIGGPLLPSGRGILAGRSTSRIGFGCGRLVGGPSMKASRRIVEEARGLGIDHFDVAPSYGMGLAEDVLGEVLAGEDAITIATKVGQGRPPRPGLKAAARNLALPLLAAAPGLKRRLGRRLGRWSGGGVSRGQFAPADVERSLAESLRRLRRDSVDVLLLHQPEPDSVTPALRSTMEQFVAAGRAGAIGSGTGADRAGFVPFGTISQFRLDLHSLPGAQPDTVLHGALRHYPRPDTLGAAQVAALRLLGRDAADPSSWAGTVLTLALARFPGAVILISSSSSRRLKAAYRAIDWAMIDDADDAGLHLMARALAIA